MNAGQVHRAKLKGREVVIKVQRPGLKDLFDIDLKNLRVGCKFEVSLVPFAAMLEMSYPRYRKLKIYEALLILLSFSREKPTSAYFTIDFVNFHGHT